jgi:predicted dehydrogenase
VEKAVFGMIGTGGIARSQHLPNLSRAPHARLKTVCDLDEERLQWAREHYGIPVATTDYHEVLADDEIQAVVVATREDMQASLTVEALGAGKHVYVEKPLASTAEECEQVAAAQEETGLFVAVGFNRRFAPAYRKAREVLDADGGARNIHYRISDEYWSWGADYPPGVRVIHEVCHLFDLIRWLTRSDAETIYCVQSRADDEAILLRMGSGCVASIMNSGHTTMDMPKERLEAIAGRGGVIAEEYVELRTYGYHAFEPVYRFPGHSHPDKEYTHKFLLGKTGAEGLYALRRMGWELRERVSSLTDEDVFPERAEMTHYIHSGAMVWNYMVDKGWLQAMDHFAECVLTGTPPENAGAADAWQASRLAHAAIESRESGQVVRL